ncbi:hypothetical protein O6H91_04G037800 [Diphasiastrum complanatum]|nr:hypothetical protein O6H91_04G037800 [Diphasiastrum complanatum]
MATLLLLLSVVRAGADSTTSPPPVNMTTTLVNAGKFHTLVDLLQSTGLVDALTQKETESGITLFAPTDDAFSALPAGDLATLTQAQISSILEYHVLPSYFTLTALESISSPSVQTLASGKSGKSTLSISTSSDIVTLNTGVDTAQVLTTLIDQSPLLAVYVINAVLLPVEIFPATPGLSPLGAPALSPAVSPPSPTTSPVPVEAVPARAPFTSIPAPFFRPFSPPGINNPGNGPEIMPGSGAPGPSSGIGPLQVWKTFSVAALMVVTISFMF